MKEDHQRTMMYPPNCCRSIFILIGVFFLQWNFFKLNEGGDVKEMHEKVIDLGIWSTIDPIVNNPDWSRPLMYPPNCSRSIFVFIWVFFLWSFFKLNECGDLEEMPEEFIDLGIGSTIDPFVNNLGATDGRRRGCSVAEMMMMMLMMMIVYGWSSLCLACSPVLLSLLIVLAVM